MCSSLVDYCKATREAVLFILLPGGVQFMKSQGQGAVHLGWVHLSKCILGFHKKF